MEATITRSPKKAMKERERASQFDFKYERYISRENVRHATVHLKQLLVFDTLVLLITGFYVIYVIVFNINRGDNIFPTHVISGGLFTIPWTDWHAWLQGISWTLGIIMGTWIFIAVANLIVYSYYKQTLPDRDAIQFFTATAQAERDIAERKAFQQKYSALYDEMREGTVSIAPAAAPAGGPTIIRPSGPLPSIKTPPKISLAPPSLGSIPIPGTAPPVPGGLGDEIRKKKPSGPVEGNKKIYVRCERCNKTLAVSIPKRLVLDNESEVVPISILHGPDEDKHVLTVYLDPDFKSRRDRVSDLINLEE
jgi:hypothetical protein